MPMMLLIISGTYPARESSPHGLFLRGCLLLCLMQLLNESPRFVLEAALALPAGMNIDKLQGALISQSLALTKCTSMNYRVICQHKACGVTAEWIGNAHEMRGW